MLTIETQINGLPVTVEFEWENDDPECGINRGVSDWWITHVNGRKVDNVSWIKYTEADEARIVAECEGEVQARIDEFYYGI